MRLRMKGDSMFKNLILGAVCILSTAFFMVLLRLTRKRGEDCPRYPYDCPYCIHAAECIDIICEQNRRRENAGEKKK